MILSSVSGSAKEATLVKGLPLGPVNGSTVTAVAIILAGPNADLSDVKNKSRLAASSGEYGFPVPIWLGYSCPR